jgi:chorismate mutase/prephenate dehydratase
MNIKDLRQQIDEADERLVEAFVKRMEVSGRIALYKKENGLTVYDPERERRKLGDVTAKAPAELRTYASALYSLLFDLSRTYQEKTLYPVSPIVEKIRNAVENTEKLFPQNPVVACQGVEGAYSQLACEKLFTVPNIMYCTSFESVFNAIDSGLCRMACCLWKTARPAPSIKSTT